MSPVEVMWYRETVQSHEGIDDKLLTETEREKRLEEHRREKNLSQH